MAAQLSVIVPFREVADQLEAFLDSLAARQAVDEVIMVGTGSTDGGAAIAEAYADRDPRFTLLRGPAEKALERAVRAASGAYLAFADPRDILAPGAYEVLVASLERTGSDLAVGRAEHAEPRKPAEHISAYQDIQLFTDRDLTGMVLRRSLAERLDLRSPAHIPSTALALARSVDVLSQITHSAGRSSIMDRRPSVAGLRDRLAAVSAVRALLPVRRRRAFDRSVVCETDLAELLEAIPVVSDREREALTALGSTVLQQVGDRAVAELPAISRLSLWLLKHRMLPELLDVLRCERLGDAKNVPKHRRGRRWYAAYPYFEDDDREIPEDVYDVTRELTPVARVDRVEWINGRLRLHGHAYIRGLDATGSRIRLWLAAPRRLRFVRLAPTRVRRPDVTADSSQSAASYDDSGFVVDIDPARLSTRRDTEWILVVQVGAANIMGIGRVCPPKAHRDRRPPGRAVADGGRLLPVIDGRRFGLLFRRRPAIVTAHRRVGDDLELAGVSDGSPEIVAVRKPGRVRLRVEVERAGHNGFRARLNLKDLCAGDGPAEWRFSLIADAADQRYAADGGQEVALSRTKSGELRATVRDPRPVVTEARWTDSDTFAIAGDHSGPDRPDTMIMRHGRSGEEHAVPLRWDGSDFAATITPSRMPEWGLERPLAPGNWDLLAGGPVRIARHLINDLPVRHRTGRHEVWPDVYDGDALRLVVRMEMPTGERGAYARHRIRTVDYPGYRLRPLRDAVVFDAYLGKQYSCNPRAIFEEIRRRETGLECLWVCADGRFAPPGATTVKLGGRAHAEALARARALVGNFNQQDWFAKREGQLYVQCWHGTPLKKIGYDVLTMPMRRTHKLSWYEHDIPQWDILVAQTPFSTPIYRKAFRYDREILEAGHPRNDVLLSPERERIAAETRRRLGIPDGKRVVLYAPTWRDDFQYAPGKRGFEVKLDLAEVSRALGPDHVVLLRTHYLVTDRAAMPHVVDVSKFPDMAELYLIADVLVTDYSSSMFDFAVTGKPMVFFAYDLERYRDQVRGFYFDLEAEAPGPVVRTGGEVIDMLKAIDKVHTTYNAAYKAFQDKFCPLDDGHASERVADRILEIIQGNE